MHLGDTTAADLPADVPAVAALHHIEELFPGAPAEATLVVEGEELKRAESRASLAELGALATHATGGGRRGRHPSQRRRNRRPV